MIRKTLFALILAVLMAGPSFAHTFELYGSVVGGDASGSYLVLETGSGPGYSRYTVVCASIHAAACAEMHARAQAGSPVGASVEGQIIKQVSGDNLTQSVRFRATYWLFTISPLSTEELNFSDTHVIAESVSSACLGAAGPSGNFNFSVTGTVISTGVSGGQVYAWLDFNNGLAFDLVYVMCSGATGMECMGLESGEYVTFAGQAVPQECASSLTQPVRFRGLSLIVH